MLLNLNLFNTIHGFLKEFFGIILFPDWRFFRWSFWIVIWWSRIWLSSKFTLRLKPFFRGILCHLFVIVFSIKLLMIIHCRKWCWFGKGIEFFLLLFTIIRINRYWTFITISETCNWHCLVLLCLKFTLITKVSWIIGSRFRVWMRVMWVNVCSLTIDSCTNAGVVLIWYLFGLHSFFNSISIFIFIFLC